MAGKFKKMGVKNWGFCLTLLQPELKKWDPFDPDLPEEIIQMMILECKYNPWYYFREIFRVPAKSGGGSGPLKANRGNIAMIWCVMNSFITYVQQIRQTGKSLNTRAVVSYFHNCAARNSQHILFTKGDLRKDEIKEYKLMRDLLPKWLWYIHAKDADNQHEFTTLSRGNRTKSYIPQGDPESANSVGRGTTPTLVTVDEAPFLPYARISIPALIASTTASFDEAKLKGAMHAILYTTTAGDLSTDSGRYVYDNIKKRGMFFSEILYDCENKAAAIKTILANSGNSRTTVPYIDISFTHLQLGYSDEWLHEKIGTTPGSRADIMRDFLGQWTFGSASNPIPEKILNRIRDNVNENYHTVINKEAYTIRYHQPVDEVKRRLSVIGLDTSNAVNRDCISGVMIDVETSETLAVFSIAETNTAIFSKWLAVFLADHPNVTLIPEAKNIWINILDTLLIELPLLGEDPGRRIYNRIVDDAESSEHDRRQYREYSTGIATERKYRPFRNQFGFPTSGTLRESLYNEVMRAATSQAASLIRDPVLIEELSTLVEKNGRIDHKASGHDDHVISWLMAQWFLRYARNLDHYGIDPRKVLSKVRMMDTCVTPKDVIKNIKKEQLLQKIEDLEARVAQAPTLMEKRYLTSKLESLKTELTEDVDSSVVNSMDKRAEDAKVKKRTESMNKHPDAIFGDRGGVRLGFMKRR